MPKNDILSIYMDKSKTWKRVGLKLKAARRKKKMTQADVAEKAGLNTNYYACIERGEENPSGKKLESIFKVLGVKSSTILPF